jgi:hypothetical protein
LTESKQQERELRWFDWGKQFAGRYVRLESDHELKLYHHGFDAEDAPVYRYTYLAVPRDRQQLKKFLAHVIDSEDIDVADLVPDRDAA